MRKPFLASVLACGAAFGAPQWIWSDLSDPAPKNRFTYFRKVVELRAIPREATLEVAADSNAWVWVNGQVVRRKMTRYHEDRITAEVIDASPYLRKGKNTVVVLHHNWGEIITFQRNANRHAGLWVSGGWIESDASWRWVTAPEFMPHEKRIVGANDPRHHRIRYPVMVDGRKKIAGDIHDAGFDDSGWKPAAVVSGGPWPAAPARVETPGQREHATRPLSVVAAGAIERAEPVSDDPFSMAQGIRTARYHPEEAAAAEAAHAVVGKGATITGRAGETRYITFDFYRPVHGYPYLELAGAPEGTRIDMGYGELAYSQYSGLAHVKPDGWLNPEGVVGAGYADRYITAAGAQAVTFPDERTARWLGVHVHFAHDGRVNIKDIGIVKSQYPVRWVGSFACGDERIEQIVKLSLIHAEVTMSDGYVDTPGREDGQWIEDARQRAAIAARWFEDTKLRRLMIRHHAESQGADGDFHAFPPSNYPAYPSAYDWEVQWAAMLYDDYMWTADKAFARQYFPNLQRFWKNVLARVGEDGVWRTRRVLADIRVGLHPASDNQSSGIVTSFMIERLRWSAVLAAALDEREQAAAWRAAGDNMAEAFRKYHVVPAKADVPAHVGDRLATSNPALERGYSQAGQPNAILAGLVSCAEALPDIDYAFAAPDGAPPAGMARWNNPTFAYRVLRMLSDCGLTERAVRHLVERYAPYLPGHPRNRVPLALQGPYGGPLPEYWTSREDRGLREGEPNTAQPRDETGSHGWGAVPLLWLHDTLLGVRIAVPGGAKLRIAPETGGLAFVAGHTMTPKGPVWVHWEPREGRLEVNLPAGVEAEIVLPAARGGMRTFRTNTAGRHVFRTS